MCFCADFLELGEVRCFEPFDLRFVGVLARRGLRAAGGFGRVRAGGSGVELC